MIKIEAINRMVERLSGRTDAENERLLSEWLAGSGETRAMFETLEKIWFSTPPAKQHPAPDTEMEWLRLQERIQHHDQHFWLTGSRQWLSAAASIVVVLVAAFYFDPDRLGKEDTVAVSASDNVIDFYLPDSSRIWLNAHSAIRYNKQFARGNRNVTLRGEAYFVVRRTQVPFSIRTRHASIRVLGTEFNLRTNDSASVVSVRKGKVMVENRSAVLELTSGESATVWENDFIKGQLTSTDFSSWRGIRDHSLNEEETAPEKFLAIKNAFRKNTINQTIVEGYIESSAATTIFHQVVLKISYTRANGRVATSLVPLEGILEPGEKIRFLKRLPDLFSKPRPVKVEIHKVKVLRPEK